MTYDAHKASAQTLADRASPYCATFQTSVGSRDVGSPLLVHRRCDSPMFDISNEIAYSGLMVQAKPKPKTLPPLGMSRWMDVKSESDRDKWSEQEGLVAVGLLQELRRLGEDSDVYLVSPFVLVQDNLRRLILERGVLDGWVENPEDWAGEHIGTVHTVQGREAKTVIFVLGAPAFNQHGARAWAAKQPNILNVAATRAKTGFYVIGNRDLWSQLGVFRDLHRLLS